MKNIHHVKNTKLVNEVFDNVYQNYDLMNDIMSMGTHRIWKKQFIDSIEVDKNQSIIDMSSGTGDITKLILKKSDHNTIYRVEPNFNMINNNIREFINYKNVKNICAFAESVPLKDNSIDLYLISFGLRNISKIDTGLKEAFRVLKKGGGFVCLEFYNVDQPILKNLYSIYSKAIPLFGKIFNQNSKPYEYLTKSISDFHSKEEISNKLSETGFKNISIKNIFGGIAAIHYAWKLND